MLSHIWGIFSSSSWKGGWPNLAKFDKDRVNLVEFGRTWQSLVKFGRIWQRQGGMEEEVKAEEEVDKE